MWRDSQVAAERSREPSTVQPHVARAIGDAALRRRVHLDRAGTGDHSVEGRPPRRIASSRHPLVRVGLESGQCRQRPSLQLERVTNACSVTDSSIDIRQARRRRPACGPSGPRPRMLRTHHVGWLEADRETHVARNRFLMTTAEDEPRSRQEHTSALESHTPSALHHIEGARLDERDSPPSRDFLIRVVMRLVWRMVEAADRDVRRREQEVVAVHWSRDIRPAGADASAAHGQKGGAERRDGWPTQDCGATPDLPTTAKHSRLPANRPARPAWRLAGTFCPRPTIRASAGSSVVPHRNCQPPASASCVTRRIGAPSST